MMEFRIADTFITSLARLNNQEQKAVKTTVFDLQINPATPGMSFHRLDRAQDPNFSSVRVNDDIRLIVHRAQGGLLICYVSHHEDAYRWAERRRLETHPTTGAAQLVEIRETVQEVIVPSVIRSSAPAQRLFINRSDEELLGFGVPPEWLEDVKAATEENILELAGHLPSEASEALLEIATGGVPQVSPPSAAGAGPFDHPDALRRFRVMDDVDELLRALEYPWEKWVVFLHPDQRKLVNGIYNGPARVSGSAGTGKTIVALHRAVHLARSNPETRVLLTTFSETLANALRNKLVMLIHNLPRLGEQIEVHSLNAIGERLYSLNFRKPRLATMEDLKAIIDTSSSKIAGHSFSRHFLETEWQQVVDDWQVETWEEYRDVHRLGRRTRLAENARKTLWSIFEAVNQELNERGLLTYAGLFKRLSQLYSTGQRPPFDFIVVDEAQDINIPQLKFLAAMADSRPNGLFFAGDQGQRIFQQPFSWKSLGVDVRGRSKTLHINYRTSHQIRGQADKLLGPEIADVDGIVETRKGTISIFNGPPPAIEIFDDEESEKEAVAVWLQERVDQGMSPEGIAIFVRSDEQLSRAKAAAQTAGIEHIVLNEKVETYVGCITICTMHLAKGLEFRAVAVMACDDEIIPLQERIETVTDASELEDVYNTERYLLYVACTRARDELLITSVKPASEFLDDLKM